MHYFCFGHAWVDLDEFFALSFLLCVCIKFTTISLAWAVCKNYTVLLRFYMLEALLMRFLRHIWCYSGKKNVTNLTFVFIVIPERVDSSIAYFLLFIVIMLGYCWVCLHFLMYVFVYYWTYVWQNFLLYVFVYNLSGKNIIWVERIKWVVFVCFYISLYIFHMLGVKKMPFWNVKNFYWCEIVFICVTEGFWWWLLKVMSLWTSVVKIFHWIKRLLSGCVSCWLKIIGFFPFFFLITCDALSMYGTSPTLS